MIPDSPSPFSQPAGAGPLLNQVLDSLLDDFQHWFERGLDLVAHCPESVMPLAEQQQLRDTLTSSLQELRAARALRGAMSETLALDMQAMAPWHRRVMQVWGLSAALREAGGAVAAGSPEAGPFPATRSATFTATVAAVGRLTPARPGPCHGLDSIRFSCEHR